MADIAASQAHQEKTPYQKAFEIMNGMQEFHDIETRFRLENIEGTAQNYLKQNLWGRAGNQFIFFAAHIALHNANSKETPAKFVECLKTAKENYAKYLPQVIDKYKPGYQKRIENLDFLIANAGIAFKAEIEVLTKRGRLKSSSEDFSTPAK